ncbi:MAG: hypothetical protein JXR56_03145 [Candidatus Cloacimonetes bacterium]|nr:hypothetical protein [Candidatus Cloacimonadota bacterium]
MKIVSFILFFNSLSLLYSIPVEEGDFRDFLYGQSDAFAYDDWLSHVAENIDYPDYNKYAPFDIQTNGFGDYTEATPQDSICWYNAIEQFVAGNYPGAYNILSGNNLPFQIVEFNDTYADRSYYLIREIPDTTYYDDNNTEDPIDDEVGAFTFGWGLVVFNPDSPNGIVISVVHPCDDFIAVPIAYEAFITLDARYLLINGAGREVLMYNHGAPYPNRRSLSDPSRNELHPYNSAYQIACNEIRDTFQTSEFALQIHSYDYTSTYPDVILSNGSLVNAALPIHDYSSHHFDMINKLSFDIPIEGDYEFNGDNTVQDYISTAASVTPPVSYWFEDGSSVPITSTNHYYGEPTNCQYLYTTSNYNSFTFKNWLHVEMHEEPGYSDNYFKFYNYNEETSTFDWEHRFDNAIAYNNHWINSLAEVLPDVMNRYDGGSLPNTPSPLTFTTIDNHQGVPYYTILEWQKSDDFNFKQYDIEMADDSLFTQEYSVIQTITNPSDVDYNLWGVNLETKKWFRIVTSDYDDHYCQSNILYIDADMQHEKIAVAPDISYRIEPQGMSGENPCIYVKIINNGNDTMTVTGISGLEYPFSCSETGLSRELEIYPCSDLGIKIYFNETRPGKYKDDFLIHVDAANTSQLNYTVTAYIPEPIEPPNLKAFMQDRGDGLYLCWEENGGSYEIYQSESPVSSFQKIATTNQSMYRIDDSKRTGFYKVVRVKKE